MAGFARGSVDGYLTAPQSPDSFPSELNFEVSTTSPEMNSPTSQPDLVPKTGESTASAATHQHKPVTDSQDNHV